MVGEGPKGFSQDFIERMVLQVATSAESVTGSLLTGGSGGDGGPGIIDLITCPVGSDCYKTRHNTYLLNKFKRAAIDLSNAPIDLSRAEKNYYIYNEGNGNGDASYNLLISSRFDMTVAEFKQNSIDRQQQFMSDLAQAIKQYQAQYTFQDQSAKLFTMRQNEQNDLIKNINYYQKIVSTSERKVVFENKNMDSLYNYRRIMVFIYYACIICFIIFGNFIPDKLYTKYSVWLIIVIVSIVPIILNITIIWLFLIYDTLAYWFEDISYKDVYRSMEDTSDTGPPAKPLNSGAAAGAAAGAGGGAGGGSCPAPAVPTSPGVTSPVPAAKTAVPFAVSSADKAFLASAKPSEISELIMKRTSVLRNR